MRFSDNPRDRVSAWARVVLPTPGKSSISRWPRARRHARAMRTAKSLPRITLLSCCNTRSIVPAVVEELPEEGKDVMAWGLRRGKAVYTPIKRGQRQFERRGCHENCLISSQRDTGTIEAPRITLAIQHPCAD